MKYSLENDNGLLFLELDTAFSPLKVWFKGFEPYNILTVPGLNVDLRTFSMAL